MIALPSIAFGGFSGSAKGVTARQTGGRTVLSVKSYPTGCGSNIAKISRIRPNYSGKVFNIFTLIMWKLGGFVRSAETYVRCIYFPMQCRLKIECKIVSGSRRSVPRMELMPERLRRRSSATRSEETPEAREVRTSQSAEAVSRRAS